jgi:hypothetical protein
VGARLDAVLAIATVVDVLRLSRVDPPSVDGRLIKCPLPGHFDGSASFSVQRSGQGFKCFGCAKTGGVLDLTVLLELARDRGAAVNYLAEYYRIPADDQPAGDFRRAQAQRRQEKELAPFRYQRATVPTDAQSIERDAQTATFRHEATGLVPIEDPRSAPGADYLRRRGIALELAQSAPVRYAARWFGRPAVVFPIRDKAGRTIAGQGRYVDGATPKTRTAGPRADGIFATPGALEADVLAIVEAPLCALSFAGCGLPAIAILGTSWPTWLPIVLAYRPRYVAVATDSDGPGDAAAEKLTSALRRLGVKVERLRLETAKDPNELQQRDPAALLDLAAGIRDRGSVYFDVGGPPLELPPMTELPATPVPRFDAAPDDELPAGTSLADYARSVLPSPTQRHFEREPATSGLCSRCAKLGRLDADRVCTFCLPPPAPQIHRPSAAPLFVVEVLVPDAEAWSIDDLFGVAN